MTGDFIIPGNLNGGLFFFDGMRRTVSGINTFPVIEPRTGQQLMQCPCADSALVDLIVGQAASAQCAWAMKSPLERSKVLLRAAELIRANLEAVAIWEVRTNGKPLIEARSDIESSADTFSFYGGIFPAQMKGDFFDLPVDGSGRFAYTRREPLGVVGCIGAWNYPFQTCCWKVAPALAAGNAVIYKPSPFAPASPVLLAELLKAAGLPNGLFNVLQGEAATGEMICMNQDIAKISFTGSVQTGMKIQKLCAEPKRIKPVTLELGGKSALIIFEDVDIQMAVETTILANFLNQGEVCTNASRVFVQKSILNEFQNALLAEMEQKLHVGDPLDERTTVGASINEQHLQRVLGFVNRAVQQGAQLLCGGIRVHPTGVEGGFYFKPAVLTGLTDEMEIVREEVFGAVCLLLPFEAEGDAIRRANESRYGLAAGVCTESLSRAHRVAAKLQAGTVYVNTYNDTEVHIPFGGYKNSGYGRENCVECLYSFTQLKSVYVNIPKEQKTNKEVIKDVYIME
ncbi:Aldedh domain-containing protein [Meloidogyne graminicola]|uniref:Aldedh domain-containing protein n=1 Tax=Meloidogyne graminicola TaxID=189291 RepID=A0A8S9ZL45_9BILA|nr:Aldedh domain-containing protein [Meloidogyne graminicola]